MLVPSTIYANNLLSDTEQGYLASRQFTMCIDPDWWPFEMLNASGQHIGIAADFHALVRERTGVQVVLWAATTWQEQIQASQAGRCQLLSFINRSTEREQWLIFTEPLLKDPNVLITREEYPLVTDLAKEHGKTIALPQDTAVSERIRREFPQLKVISTITEEQALRMVSEKKADMTLRSLIVAAHTIKHYGWFNLKINAEVPGYENQLRIGVLKSEAQLRDILNKGIASITEQERSNIINRHVEVKMVTDVDYTLAKWLAVIMLAIVLTSFFWFRRLRQLNISLQDALQEVQAAEVGQRQFIAMLSHEVRSPLAVIDSAAQLLIFKQGPEHEHQPVLARIRRGVARLSNFFDNSLAQDRLNHAGFFLHAMPLDIAEVMGWAVDQAELMSNKHVVNLEIQDFIPLIQGDQALLRIMMSNLLSNAIKFSAVDTVITVRVALEGDGCCISVADQGLGIAPEDIGFIFERFRRGRNVENIPGAGLGLALVARIVHLHGGCIEAHSTPGQGTTLVVKLPIDWY